MMTNKSPSNFKLFRHSDKTEAKKMSIISIYWCTPRVFKILYCSMILLLWVCGCGLFYCSDQEGKDRNKNLFLMCIIKPIMFCTAILLPLIIYVGGCIVALPGACKAAFPPRTCCLVSSCCKKSGLASSTPEEEETTSTSKEGETSSTSEEEGMKSPTFNEGKNSSNRVLFRKKKIDNAEFVKKS